MAKIKKIESINVLDAVYAEEPVYMLKQITEETTIAEVIAADAFVTIDADAMNENTKAIIDKYMEDETEAEAPRQKIEKDPAGDDRDAGPDEEEQREAEADYEEIENALPPDVPEKYPAKKKASKKKRANALDHDQICAMRRAGRSVKWIADELKCSENAIYVHLKQEGLK